MRMKGRYSDSAPLYAVFLTVGLAAAVAVFFIVNSILSSGEGAGASAPQQTTASETEKAPDSNNGYNPGEELSEEMKDAAQELIARNYTVLCLYFTQGLPHLDEPYGNAPEDGYFTVDSEEYTSLAQLEDLVDSTFKKKEATKIKTDPLGYGAIYKERSGGALGIIENFTGMEYSLSWQDPTFSIEPESEKVCGITLTLHDRDTGEEAVREGKMEKTSKGWKLQSLLY